MKYTEIILKQLHEMGYEVEKSINKYTDNLYEFKHSGLRFELSCDDKSSLRISISSSSTDPYIEEFINNDYYKYKYVREQAYASTISGKHTIINYDEDFYSFEYRYQLFSLDNLEAILTHIIEELTDTYYDFHKKMKSAIENYIKCKEEDDDDDDDDDSNEGNDNDSGSNFDSDYLTTDEFNALLDKFIEVEFGNSTETKICDIE